MTRARATTREAGYNLVFLIVLFGLLSVAGAAVLPSIKKQIEREKEAELIFRGLQYAEAIRVFQQRFGRPPNTLEELLEVEPRSIRQLWKDPMTENGRWISILASPEQQVGENPPNEEGQSGQLGQELVEASAPEGARPIGEDTERPQVGGPIIGVGTRKKGPSNRVFMGASSYEAWRFTVDMLPKPQIVPGTGLIKGSNVTNLGKPFPNGIIPMDLESVGGNLAPGQAPTDLFDDPEDGG